MDKKLEIVFVCYNCGVDISVAINDIVEGNFDLNDISITVIDNNSSDNSIFELENITDINLKIIKLDQNVGFGRGCNRALESISTDGRVLLLNPDIRLNADSISNLIAYADANPEAGVWGGKTVDIEGQEDGKNAWKEPSLLGVLSWAFFGDVLLKALGLPTPDAYSSRYLKKSDEVDAISGCFFLIDTALFKKLEGFDEQFFMYSEEVDLCRRARALGASPMSTNSAQIIHEGSKTITSVNKRNFLYHSKLKYCKKHWSLLGFNLARGSIFMGSLIRYMVFAGLGLFSQKRKEQSKNWRLFLKQQTEWVF